MWVVPFQATGLGEDQVAAIATTWLPFRIVHWLVMLTTIACVIVRASTDLRRARAVPRVRSDVSHLTPTVQGLPLQVPVAAGRLTQRGWQTRIDGSVLVAWRRRASLLGGSAFHVGIVLFVLAVGLFPYLSSTEEFRLIEGEQVGLDPRVPADQPSLRAAIEDRTLVQVAPSYFEDVLLFEKLDATWKRVDGREETFSLASPYWIDPVTTVSIQDFGLAPRFVVRSSADVIQDTTVAMSIFPPGAEDTIDLTTALLSVTAAAFPDHGVVNGQDVSLSYNVSNPKLRIAVHALDDPERVIGRALLAPGESLSIDHPSGALYEVEFAALQRYGSFRVARSWAMPLLLVGGVLMVVGMGVRIWRPRLELIAWDTADGLSVAVRADKVGVAAERVIAEMLASGSEPT